MLFSQRIIKRSDMRIKKLSVLFSIFVITLGFCFSFRVDAQNQMTNNWIATIIDDMKPFHEGMPHGVPKSYGWASAPRIGMGNNPQSSKAMIAWGQLYEAAEGNPAANSRVQIKDIKAYMLSKTDNKWHLLQSSTAVEGAAYLENFANDTSKSADIRSEQDGSISAKAGNGYNFHFWCTTGRVEINPYDVAGMFTTVQARLGLDNTGGQDDRSQARYLLSMGGDYWPDLNSEWSERDTIGDIAIGKFKYVTQDWKAFNMSTLSPEQIRQNPPPL
jgi:hypothetical protein